jgi:hypothetical protein
MFRTLLICAVVSASALGCSGTPQPRPDATRTATAALDDHRLACSQPTAASRIPRKPDECSPSPGRTYSQTDVERTGQTNVGDALQMLDPSITVHH